MEKIEYFKYASDMNNISKHPLDLLGYHFIKDGFIPEGKDEYYLRDIQNRRGITYRHLSATEIEILVKNGNRSDNWNNILVSDSFNPNLVKNCSFFGLIRIGKLEPYYLEFNDLKVEVGLYDSTIISCDLGDNVAIKNVAYISHYIIGNEVIIFEVDEMKTTDHAKFGNGILKDGEDESLRIWLEICNENGGRKVIPFNGMLAGDAWLWSKYRTNKKLLENFIRFTETEYRTEPGFYGKVGDRTVIKNTNIINDVWIGSDAYIKGANKLKNLTIKSKPDARSQIGEGCELVNGIIDFGCRIFYGVKAVRFVMASNSQLKYGARLINSYLGNNATISCCEVLNSLIFPAHEQHHNNSFLCAALILGQSNIPAGATIGSNHNSRAADGEMQAGRGFWPGLCVSIKHNSKFASFCIIAKGDYDYELNIPFPFSFISNNKYKNVLEIMPAYWFMYNMYALERNALKYADRDKRADKIQTIEYDYLAPDTVNEMFDALQNFELLTGKAFYIQHKNKFEISEKACRAKGKELLQNKDSLIDNLEIFAGNIENSKRKVIITKIQMAYDIFLRMIKYYGICQLMKTIAKYDIYKIEEIRKKIYKNKIKRTGWLNVGGQLMPASKVEHLITAINSGKINSWDDMHAYYKKEGGNYSADKAAHGIASLLEIEGCSVNDITKDKIVDWSAYAIKTRNWIQQQIEDSRKKDYENPFRKIMYDSSEEMDLVIGAYEDNTFINLQKEETKLFLKEMNSLKNKIKQN